MRQRHYVCEFISCQNVLSPPKSPSNKNGIISSPVPSPVSPPPVSWGSSGPARATKSLNNSSYVGYSGASVDKPISSGGSVHGAGTPQFSGSGGAIAGAVVDETQSPLTVAARLSSNELLGDLSESSCGVKRELDCGADVAVLGESDLRWPTALMKRE